MEFSEAVRTRYAVKKFDGRKVPEAKVNELLELVSLAPSSLNIQPWRIVVVTDPDVKKQLQAAAWNQEQIGSSSHVLVFCADSRLDQVADDLEAYLISKGSDKESLKGYMGMVRGSIGAMSPETRITWAQRQLYLALSNAVNGAKALGFDSCPMEGFDAKEFARILKLPEGVVPTALCPIGYALDVPRPKVRFPISRLIS